MDAVQEIKNLQKTVKKKQTRLSEIDGELKATERQMKQDFKTSPDKIDFSLSDLEKKGKQIKKGLEKGLDAFKIKYEIGNEDESEED